MTEFRRVLVVDDDVDIAELLRQRLTGLGYEVGVYHHGKGVVEEAREMQPHLILLDVMLGDDIGYHVAREIRADRLLYKIPILFQSVVSDRSEVHHAYEQGGDGFISKPYSLKMLQDGISQAQQLHERLNHVCPDTGFVSLECLRREVDLRLFRSEPLALCYVMVDGLTAYHRQRARKAIKRLTKLTGTAIRDTIRNGGFYETVPCHLGGGYFMVMVDIEDRKRFVSCVEEGFKNELIRGNGSYAGEDGDSSSGGLKLLVGRTDTSKHEYGHAVEMFNALRSVEQTSRRHEASLMKTSGHEHWSD